MTDRIVIHDEVVHLCDVFGVPFHRTRGIMITPAEVKIVVALERSGHMYVDDETDQVAEETLVFKVRT